MTMTRKPLFSVGLTYQHHKRGAWRVKPMFSLQVQLVESVTNSTQIVLDRHSWSGASAIELVDVALEWWAEGLDSLSCSCDSCKRKRLAKRREREKLKMRRERAAATKLAENAYDKANS